MDERYKILAPFTIASFLMFSSLFFGTKIAGIGLLIWMVVLGWTLSKTIFKNFSPSDLVEYNDQIVKEDWENKKYIKSSTHFIAVPMMGLGLLWVGVTIILMIFIL